MTLRQQEIGSGMRQINPRKPWSPMSYRYVGAIGELMRGGPGTRRDTGGACPTDQKRNLACI
jgi:hypothetical protein